MIRIVRALAIAMLPLSLLLVSSPCQAQPVKIQLGHGSAAEEPLWLLLAKPDLFSHYGKSYVIEPTLFAAADKRFQALEAGAIDVASLTAQFAISAAAEGVKLKALASITQESPSGFSTIFAARADSPIKGPGDLKGKTIGTNGYQGAGELWVKSVLAARGLSETDITLVNIRLPVMAESLKAGMIDVGMFSQPFAAMAEKEMKIRTIFTSKDAAPFEEELMLIVAKPEYLEKNGAAMRDFLADLKMATRYYDENTRAARQILLDKKMVRIAPEIYLALEDYAHKPSLEVSLSSLQKIQDMQVKAGFQLKRANLDALVDNSYLPKD